MKRALIGLALGALAVPAPARASSCSGADSSSSSSSDSDSSSSSTPSCAEASDVVGYRKCTGFGAWSASTKLPLLIFEWGMAMQRFDTPLREDSGSVEHEGERFTYRVRGGGDRGNAAATAVVTTARVGMGTRFGLYGAVELELGGLVEEPTRVEMTSTGTLGMPTIEQTSALAMGALGVVGYQHRARRLLVGAELLGGVRAVSYQYTSQYLACVQSTSLVVGRSVAEVRARASVFVTPMISVGAQLGTGLFDDRAWNAGVYVGGYTRAFALSR